MKLSPADNGSNGSNGRNGESTSPHPPTTTHRLATTTNGKILRDAMFPLPIAPFPINPRKCLQSILGAKDLAGSPMVDINSLALAFAPPASVPHLLNRTQGSLHPFSMCRGGSLFPRLVVEVGETAGKAQDGTGTGTGAVATTMASASSSCSPSSSSSSGSEALAGKKVCLFYANA